MKFSSPATYISVGAIVNRFNTFYLSTKRLQLIYARLMLIMYVDSGVKFDHYGVSVLITHGSFIWQCFACENQLC